MAKIWLEALEEMFGDEFWKRGSSQWSIVCAGLRSTNKYNVSLCRSIRIQFPCQEWHFLLQ